MARARMSREERAEHVAAKVAAAQEILAAEVTSLRSGEDWRRFLDFQARLHAYSANNSVLLRVQHAQAFAAGLVPTPEPTYVAGFNTWKALGRTVDKGQRGYAILAPVTSHRRVAIDDQGHARPLGPEETIRSEETEERRQHLRGFKVEHAFEFGQTSGRPVPEPTRPQLLEGEAPPGLGLAVMQLIEDRGFRVDTVADAGAIQGANGQTSWSTRTVVVRADMDDAQMVRTLLHELLTAPVVRLPSTTSEFPPGPVGSPEWRGDRLWTTGRKVERSVMSERWWWSRLGRCA